LKWLTCSRPIPHFHAQKLARKLEGVKRIIPFFKPVKTIVLQLQITPHPSGPSDNLTAGARQGINIASHLCITNIGWGQHLTVRRLHSKYIILYGRARY